MLILQECPTSREERDLETITADVELRSRRTDLFADQ